MKRARSQSATQPLTNYEIKKLLEILEVVAKTRDGNSFRAPVAELWPSFAAAYAQKIPKEVDLRSMRSTLNNGLYSNMEAFKNDVCLLYENSTVFNGDQHAISAAALDVRDIILGKIEEIIPERTLTLGTSTRAYNSRSVPNIGMSNKRKAPTDVYDVGNNAGALSPVTAPRVTAPSNIRKTNTPNNQASANKRRASSRTSDEVMIMESQDAASRMKPNSLNPIGDPFSSALAPNISVQRLQRLENSVKNKATVFRHSNLLNQESSTPTASEINGKFGDSVGTQSIPAHEHTPPTRIIQPSSSNSQEDPAEEIAAAMSEVQELHYYSMSSVLILGNIQEQSNSSIQKLKTKLTEKEIETDHLRARNTSLVSKLADLNGLQLQNAALTSQLKERDTENAGQKVRIEELENWQRQIVSLTSPFHR